MQLLLATQVADEHRHLQAVLRIYEEVFGVRGGIDAVRAVADRNMDLVAEALYARLEHHVGQALGRLRTRTTFLRAVVVYHLLAEGVIARTAQNLAANQYERLSFPGLAEGQRLVARDEARHIGIGVSYVRRRMEQAPERTSAVITRADRGAARAVVGAARPGRRRARRSRALAATASSPIDFYRRPCASCRCGSRPSATTASFD